MLTPPTPPPPPPPPLLQLITAELDVLGPLDDAGC